MKGTPIPGNGQDLTYEGAATFLGSLAADFEAGRFGLMDGKMKQRAFICFRVAVFLDLLLTKERQVASLVAPKTTPAYQRAEAE